MPLSYIEDIVDGIKEFWQEYNIDYKKFNETWLRKKVENKRAGIHLSGGEPFLDFDYVCRVIELIRRKGIYLQFIQSNGSWVTDEKIVKEKFTILKEAGLQRIFFSRTPFHAEFIPNRNIRIAVKAGEEVFGKGNVHIREMKMFEMISAIDLEDRLIPLYRFISYYGVETFIDLMKEYGLTYHARAAARLSYIFPKRPLKEILHNDCREELLYAGHFHIDPYGNYIPWACGGISFGKIGKDVISFFDDFDIRMFPISYLLCQDNGLGRLYDMACMLGFSGNTERYIDKCHLCWEIRRFIVLKTDKKYPDLKPEEFYIIKDDFYDHNILALLEEAGL